MRGTATAPNSPRDIMLGLVDPIDPIHSEIASKSKPRHTDNLGPPVATVLMVGLLTLLIGNIGNDGIWMGVRRAYYPIPPHEMVKRDESRPFRA